MPNSAPNFKAIQSAHELKWFQKMLQKEGEEKCKENKNLKDAYHGNDLAESAQIWNWRCPP